jgi:hypothetical protein
MRIFGIEAGECCGGEFYRAVAQNATPFRGSAVCCARGADVFRVAQPELPSYRKRFMGQQHRRTVKRRRREAYLERKKTKAKTAAATAKRDHAAEGQGQKTGCASSGRCGCR